MKSPEHGVQDPLAEIGGDDTRIHALTAEPEPGQASAQPQKHRQYLRDQCASAVDGLALLCACWNLHPTAGFFRRICQISQKLVSALAGPVLVEMNVTKGQCAG